MAAERAAELTEAYRILSDEGRRADYDRALGAPGPLPTPAPSAPPPTERSPEHSPEARAPEAPASSHEEPPRASGQFKEERATVDQFVRKAAVGRFRQALAAIGGSYDEAPLRGFDIACVPKAKLFGRGKGPALLARFVSRVDAESVADTLALAVKSAPGADEVCVFLMGSGMAPPRELAGAIAEQRRKTRSLRLMLIPIDARNWDAHIPNEAPPIVKDMLARMRSAV